MKKMLFSNIVLIASLLIAMAIASTEVPLWISLFAVSMIIWRFLFEKYNFPKISKNLASLIAVLIFIIIYLQYKTIFGQEESSSILLALVSIAILNFENQRDSYFIILLGFLLVVLKSIFSIDFIWVIPAILAFFGLWYSLISNSKVNKIQFLFNTTLRALPLFIFLFIVFPRIVIFQTKKVQTQNSKSGFSEDLNPGQISQLALQDQTVFTAKFKDSKINKDQMYWRGAVLNESQGFIWKVGKNRKSDPTFKSIKDDVVDYTIILDPLNLNNIFTLDLPLKIISSTLPIQQYQHQVFYLNQPTAQQIQYVAQSTPNASYSNSEDFSDLQSDLIYPELPKKTKALISEIKLKNLTPMSRINALKEFFAKTDFIYTIKPDFYKNNLDEFLFIRKKGFCEHFAAAFGTMSRALDVPARLVIGYQGGLYNPIGKFWKVSQKDAHAWVEVFIDNHWLRVDPTALISPLRISMGAEDYFSLTEEEQIYNSKNPDFKNNKSYLQTIYQFNLFLDNLNYQWSLFLLNYDLQTQLSYLKKFQSNKLLIFIFILTFVVFLFYNRHRHKILKEKKHDLYKLIFLVESWALENGIEIDQSESPLHSIKIIIKKFPDLNLILSEISKDYELLIYKEEPMNTNFRQLEKRWFQLIQK